MQLERSYHTRCVPTHFAPHPPPLVHSPGSVAVREANHYRTVYYILLLLKTRVHCSSFPICVLSTYFSFSNSSFVQSPDKSRLDRNISPNEIDLTEYADFVPQLSHINTSKNVRSLNYFILEIDLFSYG